jgi:hypothetical protein
MDRQIPASVAMGPGLRRDDEWVDRGATFDKEDHISLSEQIKNTLASV